MTSRPSCNDSFSIVVIANVVWPKYGIAAGGFQHALEVARELAADHEVTVIVPDFVAPALELNYPNLTVVTTKTPRFARHSTLAALTISIVNWLPLAGKLRHAGAALAASHFLGDVLPAIVARPGRATVIVHHLLEGPHLRSGAFLWNLVAFLHERLSLAVAKRTAGAIITSSQLVATKLARLGFRQPIIVTTNAPRGFSMQSPPAADRVEGRVLYVGRLSPTKGIEHLIASWPTILEKCPFARLHLVGDGDPAYRQSLERLAEKVAGADTIRFLGRVDDDSKEREFFEAAVFAFPSLEEGFGIALVEAMRAGLPSVTFDLPVFREFFTRGRLIVKIGDEKAFGAAVGNLLGNDSERIRLASEALESSATFSWSRAAELDLEAIRHARR